MPTRPLGLAGQPVIRPAPQAHRGIAAVFHVKQSRVGSAAGFACVPGRRAPTAVFHVKQLHPGAAAVPRQQGWALVPPSGSVPRETIRSGGWALELRGRSSGTNVSRETLALRGGELGVDAHSSPGCLIRSVSRETLAVRPDLRRCSASSF